MNPLERIDMTELSREYLEKVIFDLQNLLEIGLSLSSNLEFDSLVEAILYICIGHMVVDKGAIFLNTDLESDELTLYISRGYVFESNLKIEPESKLVKYLYSYSDILDFNKAKELMLADSLTKDIYEKIEPEIIIPLKSKNSINGLIFLGKKIMKTPYSVQNLQFLRNMAKFASIAVENSRLYRMATLDRMTGLYIHHYFQERLIKEIKKVERSNVPLTLLMSDLDHFKSINDTYGHHQGDIILKGTAKLMQQNIRGFDIAARYGGEEFAIILTETGIDEAFIIAERLRKIIENEVYTNEITDIKITISIGLAQYNNKSGESGIDLIKRADSALYSAKRRGRNMTVKFESDEENVE
ncbi:MAG: sensor domain-containing diguanylate cyclase [Leptospirales bacterium]|nr:sensor domain-containing diguanylate cyclase [Leptospirales bacterium]